MGDVQSNRRTDEQLEFILAETRDWVVHGTAESPPHRVASLRMAVERVGAFTARGREIIAVAWEASDGVVVSLAQLQRLAILIAEREPLLPREDTKTLRVA